MKILITTDWYKPVINGVVTSVVNLAEELENKGHEVKILTMSQNNTSMSEENVYYIRSFDISRIYPQARGCIAFKDPIIKELIAWKPDIIHSQCEFMSFSFAKKIAKKCDIPIIHTYHTVYEDYTHYFTRNENMGRKAVALWTKHIMRMVDSIVVPTDKMKKMLLGYGINQEIYVQPSGIKIKNFDISENEKEVTQLKEDLGIPEHNTVLVSVGRLAKEKNTEELIYYYADMNRKNISLLIVGDGPYRKELEKIVNRLNLREEVLFTGMVPPEKVPLYYSAGDVFVSASQSETQGLTYIEALAAGLPAVCRKDECLEDVIYDGYNGYQYQNYKDFEYQITEIISNDEIRETMKAAALQTSSKYSAQTFVRNIENIYFREILKKKSRLLFPILQLWKQRRASM